MSLGYLASCFATIRSNNFKNTDRLEIGRKDLGSAGSRSAFFSKGVMYADRNEAGTRPDEIDALIRRHINGDSSATLLLSSRVGKRSDAHCLSGRARISSMTSDSETGEKTDYSQSLINKHSLTEELAPNLNDEIKYVLQYENLRLYLELGLELVKIYRILQFSQSAWIKPYIDFNTIKRKEATPSFLQNLFKLYIIIVLGKTMKCLKIGST